MTVRSNQTVISFDHPFLLPGFEDSQPAGDYRVDFDEELLEAGSRLAWRSTGAFIHLPAIGAPGTRRQMVPVSPSDLDALRQKLQRP